MAEPKRSENPVWTLIAEFNGGTYISQRQSPTLREFLQWWLVNEAKQNIPNVEPIDVDEDFYDPVEIEGVNSVWCTSTSGGEQKLLLINVVKTDVGN